MCLRKRRFTGTKAEVEADAARAGARYNQQIRVYRCPYCQCWHRTTTPYDYNQFKGRPART